MIFHFLPFDKGMVTGKHVFVMKTMQASAEIDLVSVTGGQLGVVGSVRN